MSQEGQFSLQLEEGLPPWPLLDERQRGTAFEGLPVRRVLNPPLQLLLCQGYPSLGPGAARGGR
jgi:hypothetical protein